MRIAVLADIHGNLPALEAVLADVDRRAVDRIVLNGDIAGGPLPGQTLDRLAEFGERAIGSTAMASAAWSLASTTSPTPPPTNTTWRSGSY
jgi:Icc-related predicted phosphoesterase